MKLYVKEAVAKAIATKLSNGGKPHDVHVIDVQFAVVPEGVNVEDGNVTGDSIECQEGEPTIGAHDLPVKANVKVTKPEPGPSESGGATLEYVSFVRFDEMPADAVTIWLPRLHAWYENGYLKTTNQEGRSRWFDMKRMYAVHEFEDGWQVHLPKNAVTRRSMEFTLSDCKATKPEPGPSESGGATLEYVSFVRFDEMPADAVTIWLPRLHAWYENGYLKTTNQEGRSRWFDMKRMYAVHEFEDGWQVHLSKKEITRRNMEFTLSDCNVGHGPNRHT